MQRFSLVLSGFMWNRILINLMQTLYYVLYYVCRCQCQMYQRKVDQGAYIMSIKELFNCKTRMPGTVKCRPTVAYCVQIDGIIIATELITRYYLNGTLIQCCFNARPTSATLAQH